MFKGLFALALGSLLFVAVAQAEETGLKVGDKAPCVVLHQLNADGTESNGCVADSNETQKFTLVNFMSIYCGYCIAEIPTISKLNKDLGAIAAIRSVSIEKAAYEKDVRKWYGKQLELKAVNYSLALDSDRNATTQYKISATPTTYIVDKKGIIVWAHLGEIEAAEEAQIRAIIK